MKGHVNTTTRYRINMTRTASMDTINHLLTTIYLCRYSRRYMIHLYQRLILLTLMPTMAAVAFTNLMVLETPVVWSITLNKR